jgi:hypothetical protein
LGNTIQCAGGIGFSQVGVAGDGVDEVGFVHVYVLFEKT